MFAPPLPDRRKTPASSSPGRRAADAPINSTQRAQLLQQSIGNQAVTRLNSHGRGPIQRRLLVGSANDPLEHEADTVAERVLAAPQPDAREGAAARTSRVRTGEAPSPALRDALATGQPLDAGTRQFFESRFAEDFSDVRVHTGARAEHSARALGASAYTTGEHIVFGEGQFAPSTSGGRRVLAHELAHVAQQREGRRPAGAPVTGQAAVQRQLAPAFPITAVPPQSAVSTSADPIGEMEIKEELFFEAEHPGELEPIRVPRFVYQRRVHIKTRSGAEADVTIYGTTDFPGPVDTSLDSRRGLQMKGMSAIGYTLNGKLADGTPVVLFDVLKLPNSSLPDLAKHAPPFAHFGLSAEQQYQTIVDVMRGTVTDESWRKAEKIGLAKREAEYPSQEQFKKLTRGEKSDLFWKHFWNELGERLTSGKFWADLGIAVGIAIVMLAAAVFAAPAFFVLAFLGLVLLLKTAITDLVKRIKDGDYGQAVVGFLKDLALVVALVAGTLAVATLLAGGAIVLGLSAAALGTIALIAVGVALVLMGVLILLNHGDAVSSDNVDQFKGEVQEAADTGVEGIITVIVTIITIIAGKFIIARGPVVPKGERPPVERPPVVEQPPLTVEQPPVIAEKPPVVVDKPPVVVEQPPLVVERPPLVIEEPPVVRRPPVVEEPPVEKPPAVERQPGVTEPEGTTTQQDKKSPRARAKAPVEDPQQGVRDALSRTEERIKTNQAEIDDHAPRVREAFDEAFALKEKAKTTKSTDPEHAQQVEDFRAAQKRYEELKQQQEHRKFVNDQEWATRNRLKAALDAKTYERPGFWKAFRDKVWAIASENGTKKVFSPSGTEIKPGDPWVMGHKPRYEFWKHVRSAAERGITREQFLREYFNEKMYRPETPDDNSSHFYEDHTDAYDGP